jgi:hypothetical protein
VPKLGPNQTRRFIIDFAILTSEGEVLKANGEIAHIQAARKIELDAEPARVE